MIRWSVPPAGAGGVSLRAVAMSVSTTRGSGWVMQSCKNCGIALRDNFPKAPKARNVKAWGKAPGRNHVTPHSAEGA